MTELFARVVATFEWPAALPSADVLSFVALCRRAWCGTKRSALLPARLSLTGLLFPCTAVFVAHVSTTVERRATNTHALRWLISPLMAHGSV